MSDCPVFNAFIGVEAVWDEIYRLTDEIPDAFKQHGLFLSDRKEESHDAGHTYTRMGFSYEMRGRISKRRSPRQLLFLFDLWRPAPPTSWPHAQEALLTIAYAVSAKADEDWDAEYIVIGTDGRLADDDMHKGCVPHAGGRLLEWKEDREEWHERAWLFSVPLTRIDGPVAFQREVVEPVIALLLNGTDPAEALKGTHAIRFNT